jgi:hypothetical protein
VSNLVDDYLMELRKLLPKALRKDIAAEVEDHLQESASSNGEEVAVARFGSAQEVARAFAGQAALHDIRRAAVLLVLAVVPFGLASLPFPRDLIPAWGASSMDRWPEQAPQVAGQQDAILVLFCASVGLVLLGVVASALRWRRIGLILHTASSVATIALGTMTTVLAVRWERALPAAPSLFWIVLYAFVGAVVLAAATRLGIRAGRTYAAARGGVARAA